MSTSDPTHGTEPTLTPGGAAGCRLLTCPRCGANYDVRNWTTGRAVRCPACSVDLTPPRVDRVLDASGPSAPVGEVATEGKPFGRYRLLSQLGHGGMGVVWKAWDAVLHRHVAIKGILSFGDADRTQIERFQREAQSAAKLRHPNIVTVHDVGLIEGQHYICADFVDGESLEKRTGQPWPVRKALDLIRTVAEALQYAHDQGIVHRDVKPANILLDSRDQPFVADFGLAKDVKGSDATAITGSGDLLGTPSYMSPEQARGDARHIGPASDQFSLGVVLYELLTGRRAFAQESHLATMKAVADADPPRPTSIQSKIHRDVETICLKALEKDPLRRYARIGELAADIVRYLEGEPIEAKPIGRIERLARKAGKHRAIVIPTAAAVLLGVAAAIGAGLAKEAKEGEGEARAARGTAERHLAKAMLVADVFGRWNLLASSVRDMERAAPGYGLPEAEQKARMQDGWEEVQAFLARTPRDSASQATARALAAWPRSLVAGWEEGRSWARSACGLDDEVPFPHLMLALLLFTEALEHRPLPRIVIGPRGIEVEPPLPETSEEAKRGDAIEECLATAETRPVWGREGANAFRAAAAGFRAFRRGDYAAADVALSEAIAATDTRTIERPLLLACANARYLHGAYEEAIRNVKEVLASCPDQPVAQGMIGDLHLALAGRQAGKGLDPRPILRAAIAAYGESLRLLPQYPVGLANRGAAWFQLAQAESNRGSDPRGAVRSSKADLDAASESKGDVGRTARLHRAVLLSWWGRTQAHMAEDPLRSLDEAIEDLKRLLDNDPEDLPALVLLGSAQSDRGDALSAKGIDPRKSYQESVAVLSKALSRDPHGIDSLASRGMAHYRWGQAELARGGDPREQYQRADEDLREGIRLCPEFSEAISNLGVLCQDRAMHEASLGGDPRPLFEEALRLFGRALERLPGDAETLCSRGTTHSRRAEIQVARKEDPREAFDLATADFAAALAANPLHPFARVNRANLWFRRAEWEQSAGIDAEESLLKAIEDCSQTIEQIPSQARAWATRGAARIRVAEGLLAKGKDARTHLQAAIEDLGKAASLRPGDPSAVLNRGGAYFALAQADIADGRDARDSLRKSIADFGTLIEANPRDLVARSNRAIAHEWIGELDRRAGADPGRAYRRAVEDLEAILDADPGRWESAVEKGGLHEALEEWGKAVQCYEHALRIVGDTVPDVQARLDAARAKLPR